MRRALVGLAVAIGLATHPTAAPGAPSRSAVGFEHNLHDRDLVVSGAESLPCTRCHAMKAGALTGKPGHAACFGACHGPAPLRGARPGDRLAICTACHAEAVVLADPPGRAVHYPPYALEPNFAITVGHRRHLAVGCAQCHTGGKPAPHRRCAGCHDGSAAAGHGPAMTACTGCHMPAAGRPLPPSILHAEVNVAGAFSHAKHAARGGAGARCLLCHVAVLDTDDNILPAPSAETCAAARCHDGAAAFAITFACTRCHLDPGDPGFKVARPTLRYSHEAHIRRAGDASPAAAQPPCAICHPLARTGEVGVVGHGPCATCHADDFGRRQPRICGACHNATEPWRALVADRSPVERTELGATLDHENHPGPCADCHRLTTPASQLRPPRGHRACTGRACHAVTGGPSPPLTACESCHRAGRARDREAARLAAPWSVRAKFDHASHAQLTLGHAPACIACHVDLRAADATSLPTPPKATCAPCHDGTTAFKLTGTTCTRCHQGAQP